MNHKLGKGQILILYLCLACFGYSISRIEDECKPKCRKLYTTHNHHMLVYIDELL